MKNYFLAVTLFFFLLMPESVLSQETSGPVYVNGMFLIGESIVEFALDGNRRNLIQRVEPFVYNGKLHFFSLAVPFSSGGLRQGFNFHIELNTATPRKFAVYNGEQRDLFLPFNTPVPVRGYATKGGQIIITEVFVNLASAEAFLNTVPLAFN